MRFVVLMAFFALNGAGTLAAETAKSEIPCLGALCGRKPLELTSTLTYDLADELYRTAGPVTQNDLAGTWTHIAVLNHPLNKKHLHTGSPDRVNLEGLERKGRILLLEFAGHKEGDHWVAQVPFGVSIKHLGETQSVGPYWVTINDNTAQFATYGYRHGRTLTKDFWYVLECRMSAKKDLYCAMTPEGELANGGYDSRQWGGKRVGFYVFKKLAQ